MEDLVHRMELRDHSHPDYKAGIRAYITNVLKCRACGRDTNLVFEVPGFKGIIACSKKCAEKIAQARLMAL